MYGSSPPSAMSLFERFRFFAVSSSLLLMVVALAVGEGLVSEVPPEVIGTEGWEFGGTFCGCLANEDAAFLSCKNCCDTAVEELDLTPEEGQNCIWFCKQACFPCTPGGEEGVS